MTSTERPTRRTPNRRRSEDLLSPDAALLAVLEKAAPAAVAARASDRLAYAHDASHYLLVPRAVVTPRDATQVSALLSVAAAQGVPLTFRSGGTSLSGQSTNDGVLVDTQRHFRRIEVLDGGERVRVQPGATVRAVNSRLVRHGRKLGPDPASEIACTIGGVIANNSSGMACGTQLNTYQTLESAVLVLPSGTVIDTGSPDADDQLGTLEPAIYEGLAMLRDRVRGNPDSVGRIGQLFSIKNTMGYGVNSFVDHTRPVDLLSHLVIGSEGTLAFVAEATFRTVPAYPHAATALLLFPDLTAATGALPALVSAGFATIELLDQTSLRVAQADPGAPADLRALQVREHTGLLVEHQQPSREELHDQVAATAPLLANLPLVASVALSTDAATRASLWHIRKGLYTAVAGARPSGTTALLEDIAVPVEQLLPTCSKLTELFDKHGYEGSVIFGHAKDGNVHFMLNENFDNPENVSRYLAFTDDMVELVLGSGGTLKAEHGTGRIMAPFVRRQYGDELYDVMSQIKQLIDPSALLNPGVLLDEDPAGHISHLKSAPTVEAEVDRCVECGYCEPVCPSKDLTTTPRRRIVLRREMAQARDEGDVDLLTQLEEEYQYDAVDTCAVDGMCQPACPVLIDTGDLVRRLRGEQRGRIEQRVWKTAAKHWDGTTRAAATGLNAAGVLPPRLTVGATGAARAMLGEDTVPAWSSDLPAGGAPRRSRSARNPQAVYFPACISTMFGPTDDCTSGVQDAFLALCDRAEIEVLIPESIGGWCCGTPWKSKGLTDGWAVMRDKVVPSLLRASQNGALPVVVDAASCTEGLITLLEGADRIRVLDAVTFVDSTVLPLLPPVRKVPSLVVHPTCSSTQMGLDPAIFRVAAVAADTVICPQDWGCCAFAGDRGLLHPELTASATVAESEAIAQHPASQDELTSYASVNRTCEIGMTRATGHPYRHLLEVLELATRPLPA